MVIIFTVIGMPSLLFWHVHLKAQNIHNFSSHFKYLTFVSSPSHLPFTSFWCKGGSKVYTNGFWNQASGTISEEFTSWRTSRHPVVHSTFRHIRYCFQFSVFGFEILNFFHRCLYRELKIIIPCISLLRFSKLLP